jgi:hypothetical protein
MGQFSRLYLTYFLNTGNSKTASNYYGLLLIIYGRNDALAFRFVLNYPDSLRQKII